MQASAAGAEPSTPFAALCKFFAPSLSKGACGSACGTCGNGAAHEFETEKPRPLRYPQTQTPRGDERPSETQVKEENGAGNAKIVVPSEAQQPGSPLIVEDARSPRVHSSNTVEASQKAKKHWAKLRMAVHVCSKFTRTAVKGLKIQAAGHEGDILTELNQDGSVSDATILKKVDEKELANYKQLFLESGSDTLQHATPGYFGETSMQVINDGKEEVGHYMRLTNLLSGFKEPKVMDCKLGTRTYQEQEAKSKKERDDLFKKLEKLPNIDISEAERANGTCTKYRWMRARDSCSSTLSLGFRIDGIAGPGDFKRGWKDFCGFSKTHDVVRELKSFLPVQISAESQLTLALLFVDMLQTMQTNFEQSPFFRDHEFIGTSLLFIVETSSSVPARGLVRLIDLAKTSELPEGITIDHRSTWTAGNHEDGMLFGIENCISCWQQVANILKNGGTAQNGSEDTSAGRARSQPEDVAIIVEEDKNICIPTSIEEEEQEYLETRLQPNEKSQELAPTTLDDANGGNGGNGRNEKGRCSCAVQ